MPIVVKFRLQACFVLLLLLPQQDLVRLPWRRNFRKVVHNQFNNKEEVMSCSPSIKDPDVELRSMEGDLNVNIDTFVTVDECSSPDEHNLCRRRQQKLPITSSKTRTMRRVESFTEHCHDHEQVSVNTSRLSVKLRIVLRQLLKRIRNETSRLPVISECEEKPISSGHVMVIMNRQPSAYPPLTCRQSVQANDNMRTNVHQESPMSRLDTTVFLQIHFATFLSIPHQQQTKGVGHIPPIMELSPKLETLSPNCDESTEAQLSEISHHPRTEKRLVEYPFWSKLFAFKRGENNAKEHKQESDLTDISKWIFNPNIKEILFSLMVLMTVMFRHLPLLFKDDKTKRKNNLIVLKLLTKSFFLKWTWRIHSSLNKESTNHNTDHKETHASWWKISTLDNILHSLIVRPWLTKASYNPCQHSSGCCSSASSLCPFCRHQVNTFMASPHRTFQVSPAFLPDPSRTPGQDLAHVGYRLVSLSAVSSSFPVSRIKLADAGFFFTGRGRDQMTCYSCGASRSSWSKGDNPMDIHRELSPGCQHVRQRDQELASLGSEPWGSEQRVSDNSSNPRSSTSSGTPANHASHSVEETNVSERPEEDSGDSEPSSFTNYVGVSGSPQHYALSATMSNVNDSSSESQPNPPTSTTSSSSSVTSRVTAVPPSDNSGSTERSSRRRVFPTWSLDLGGAVYPMYHTMGSRRGTFSSWDHRRAPSMDQMLLAGMFYAGYADCVRCFYCGVGLKNWVVSDSAWDEHVRWRPECGYVRTVKGEQFVTDTQRRLNLEDSTNSQEQDNASPTSTSSTTPSVSSSLPGNGEDGSGRPNPAPPTHPTHLNSPRPNSLPTTGGLATLNHTPSNQLRPASPAAISQASDSARNSTGSSSSSSSSAAGCAASSLMQGAMNGEVEGEEEGRRRRSRQRVVTSNTAESEEPVTSRQEDQQELARRLQCTLCHRANVGAIFVPCGHLVACETCAGSVTSCPLCGVRVLGVAKVHFEE